VLAYSLCFGLKHLRVPVSVHLEHWRAPAGVGQRDVVHETRARGPAICIIPDDLGRPADNHGV
jgi:hypothetical protein